MRTEKGQPGYVKARKQKYLLGAVVEFAIVIAIFVTGYIQTGSRLNLLTVVAVVGCLPAAKMLVEFITMAPYKSIEEAKYQELEEIFHDYTAFLSRAEGMNNMAAVEQKESLRREKKIRKIILNISM